MSDDLTTQRNAMLSRMAQAIPKERIVWRPGASAFVRAALTELSMDSALSESEERAILAMRDEMSDATAAKLWRLMR